MQLVQFWISPLFLRKEISIIFQETLWVKDEELQQLARELRARDSTIKEIAEKLSDTAEAAEAAATAAHALDGERRVACAEIERLTKESEKQLESSMLKVSARVWIFATFLFIIS